MTRPPRPKYPSDSKNYHEIRRPGCAQTIRLPEELLDTYVTLRRCLGTKTSHATVIRFLFEAADATITAVIQAEDARIIQDSQLHPSVSNCNQEEPEFEDVEDSEDEELSNEETREKAGLGGVDVDSVLCADSQLENVIRNPPLRVFPDASYGFCSKMKEVGSSWKIETMALEQALTMLKQKGLTIEEVVHDDNAFVDAILIQYGILSSKDLWHKCKNIMSKFKEVLQEKRRTPSNCSVEAATTIAQVVVFSIQQLKDFCKENGLPGGETHKAVKDFLKKYLTENKMKFYLRARENFISEMFHLVINKYATKRIHFNASHTTRLACAALDWNENICHEVRVVYNRVSNDTAVRWHARTNRDLVARMEIWKAKLKSRVFA
ncbi:hypothetical protein R1flu_007932 [Riccia fluitans]|uniref:Uncharacterized protein n=1 Tax=Riccia fluitans TaxID=41844 RepID=A0ABD1Z097_9MARC